MPVVIEWFYMDIANEQQGPVTVDGLRHLYEQGDLHDFSFVWNESMANWGPIKDQPGVLGGGDAQNNLMTAHF